MSSFAEATTWPPDGPGRWRGRVPQTWMQGRGSFGGIVAALGLRAARAVIEQDRLPRSVHTSFFGPLGAEPAEVHATQIRHGRYVTHARAEILQGEGMRAQVTATFADDRPSAIVVEPPPPPAHPGPDGLVEMPFVPGVTPEFTQYFAFRWTHGTLPYSGKGDGTLSGWCRHRTDPGTDPHVALLGLLDAWPSPVISLMSRPGPSSSVTWTTTFFEVPPTLDPEAWWWYRSEVVRADRGYAGMRAGLHASDGRLVAMLEQLVAVFDAPP